MRTERSAPVMITALLALAGTLSGCGIRPTSVPVDAGAAPSRVSCALPSSAAAAPTASPSASPTASPTASPAAGAGQDGVRVYLVCSGEVTAVRRTAPTPTASPSTGTGARERLAAARTLLDELQAKPDDEETDAGFSTDVPGDLDVSGPRRGDPATALRLSDGQDQLPSFALAQIVCTFARTAAGAGADGSVVLGFAGSGAARGFTCTGELRTQPEVARTAGTAVG